MAKVIFMGFDAAKDGLYHAAKGEPIVRLAKDNGIPINFECQDGDCASCLIRYENIEDNEPTNYIEDKELDKLVELGVLKQKEAEHVIDGVKFGAEHAIKKEQNQQQPKE